jgi:hypothetical protein
MLIMGKTGSSDIKPFKDGTLAAYCNKSAPYAHLERCELKAVDAKNLPWDFPAASIRIRILL